LHNVITNNVATMNISSRGGGGIYCAHFVTVSQPPLIANNTISFNRAQSGGGIFVSAKGAVIVNNRIEGNFAVAATNALGAGFGGGVFLQFYGATVINNFFLNNIATNGLTCTYSSGVFYNPFSGGGISADWETSGPATQIINNTFLGNRATSLCSGVPAEQGGGIEASAPTVLIVNNIVCFGSSGVMAPTYKFRNNCVFGNNINYIWANNPTGTNGNISVDPLLVSPSDFHLSASSPCVNSGTNGDVIGTVDLDGNPRIADGTVDMGACEFQPLSPFRMFVPTITASGVAIQWQSVAGRNYFVQRSTNLAAESSFLTVQTNIAGVPDMTTYIDAAAGPGANFYRVGVQP
jgi:hypothetical protein